MRVPSNADAPTFDETFSVGFMRRLTASGDERREWARRRKVARQAWNRARLDGIQQRHDTRRGELLERQAEIKEQIGEQLARRPRRRR